MRVCLVSRELAPFFGGGIAGYVVEMALALQNAGHEVHILTHPHPGLSVGTTTNMPGVRVHAVNPQPSARASNAATFSKKSNSNNSGKAHTNHDPRSNPNRSARISDIPGAFFCHATWCAMAAHEKLLELHNKHPFDYIEIPDYRGEGYWIIRAARTVDAYQGAVIGVRLHAAHHVVAEHDNDPIMTIDRAHIAHMERWSIANADLVLSASNAMLRKACDGLAGSLLPEPEQCRAIVRLPMRLPEPPQRSTPSPPPTVLYAGRIQHLKGVDTLTKAAVILLEQGTDANFLFVGADTKSGRWGSSMLAQTRKLIPKKYASRFEFRPAAPRAEIPALINTSAVSVFPSRFESFSYACIEAMARGAAVVVSDAGSLPELVTHERHGLVFSAENQEACAACINRLLTDHHLADRLRKNAIARAAELCDPLQITAEVEHWVNTAQSIPKQSREEAEQNVREAFYPRAVSHTAGVKPVTIVVPHYNAGELLEETIETLLNQTWKDYDILIVDDGSTDYQSIETVNRIEANRDVRVLRKPNGGLGSARNAGFHATKSPYVISFDADDLAEPDLVETLLAAIARQPEAAFCASMFTSFNEDDPATIVSGYVPLALDPDLIIHHNIAGPGSGTIYRRETIINAGGFDESMTSYEDWELWCRLASLGHQGLAIPRVLFRYRIRCGSLLRTAGKRDGDALRQEIATRYAAKLGDPSIPLRLAQTELARKTEELAALRAELEKQRAAAKEQTAER